jgi:hypothetical protein
MAEQQRPPKPHPAAYWVEASPGDCRGCGERDHAGWVIPPPAHGGAAENLVPPSPYFDDEEGGRTPRGYRVGDGSGGW